MADVATSIDFAPLESMIWSEEEAKQRQIDQVGTSACGATAALNVLVIKYKKIVQFSCLLTFLCNFRMPWD